MEALRGANDIRVFRKQLKRDLKDGNVKVRELLLDPPKEIETMQIESLLLAVPYVGPLRASKLLWHCHVSPVRHIGDLTERQRTELARETQRL